MQLRLALICWVSLVAICLTRHASAQTWVGPDGGSWSDEDNWNPHTVPNNAPPLSYATATIPTGSVVVDGGFNLIGLNNNGQVTIGAGGGLSFVGPTNVGGNLSNNGTINVTPDMGATVLGFSGNAAHTLSGTGQLVLGGNGLARVLGNTNGTLTSSNTIIGEGNFIEGFMYLHTSGNVIASGGTLNFAPGGCTNTGVISAAANGTLQFNGSFGTLLNSGGTISANGGRVRLSNAVRITGGVLTTSGNGSIETIGGGASNVLLTDVANRGHFFVNTAITELQGNINNTGSFNLNLGSTIRALNSATLSGSGSVIMTSGTGFTGANGDATLANSSNTIVGVGALGNDTLKIINQAGGTIRASGGTLTINPSTRNLINSGLIEAETGATLVLSGFAQGEFRNNGDFGMAGPPGTIRANHDARVLLTQAAQIIGGTLSCTGTGTFLVPNLNDAIINDVHLDAAIIHVAGILRPRGQGSGLGTVLLSGSGEIRTNDLVNESSHYYLGPQNTFRNDPFGSIAISGAPQLTNNGEIAGAGSLGANTLTIINNGTIAGTRGTAGEPQPLNVNPSAGGLTNGGVIETRNFGIVQLDGNLGGIFAQTGGGTIRALGSGNVQLLNNPTISGGMFGAGTGSISVGFGTPVIENVTSDANFVQNGLSTVSLVGNVINTGTMSTTIGSATLLVTGGSTLNSASGAIANNGRLVVSPGGNADANFITGTGTVLVRSSAGSGGQLRAHSIRQANLTIDDDANATLTSSFVPTADATRLTSLTMGATSAILDITNRLIVIDYGGASPLPTLRQRIASGYANGAWTGFGIRSSSAAANPGRAIGYAEANQIFTTLPADFFGETVDITTALIRYTWYGDTDLNGVINFDDYARLDSGFNNHGDEWFEGDFNYDGVVNFDDYSLIDLAFNTQSGALVSDVPEPAFALAGLATLAVGFLRRRRTHVEHVETGQLRDVT